MRIITPESWRPQPWRNGAGVTHELVRWPDDDAFVVRISVADVTAPAPFSEFPGLDRWLYLLAGGPVTLALASGEAVLVAPGDHVEFSGDARVAATAVARPSRDLNFMVRAGRARAELRRTSTELAGAAVVAFAIAGEVSANGAALAVHACAWATGETIQLALGPGALAATLVISPR